MAVRRGRLRQLRRQVRAQLQELNLRPPLDVHQLCQRLGEHREKPLVLVPRAIDVPGPFGLWFGFSDRDYIVFQQDTPKWQQDRMILHDLGHMLAEHPSGGEPSAGTVFNDDAPQEQEADFVADVIQKWYKAS